MLVSLLTLSFFYVLEVHNVVCLEYPLLNSAEEAQLPIPFFI